MRTVGPAGTSGSSGTSIVGRRWRPSSPARSSSPQGEQSLDTLIENQNADTARPIFPAILAALRGAQLTILDPDGFEIGIDEARALAAEIAAHCPAA